MRMEELTGKQQAVLRRLQEGWRMNGRCPTYRKLAGDLRLSVKSVFQHVLALEKKDLLSRNGRAGIRLSPAAEPPRGAPLYQGRVGAGPPGTSDSAIEEHIELMKELGLDRPGTFLVQVRGESMVKRGVQNGDIVVARCDAAPADGDVAVVVVGEEAVVKTINTRSGHLRLFSEPRGGGLREITLPKGQAPRVWGRVVAAFRFMKSVSALRDKGEA